MTTTVRSVRATASVLGIDSGSGSSHIARVELFLGRADIVAPSLGYAVNIWPLRTIRYRWCGAPEHPLLDGKPALELRQSAGSLIASLGSCPCGENRFLWDRVAGRQPSCDGLCRLGDPTRFPKRIQDPDQLAPDSIDQIIGARQGSLSARHLEGA